MINIMTMEITINIKLEDEDISLLIKSLWEIIKKFNKEDSSPIEILKERDLKEVSSTTEIFKEKDLKQCEEFLNTTDDSYIYHEYAGTDARNESVIEIDKNQKKNEEN